MGGNFVRLTVLSGNDQLDVSLPAHRPLVEYIDDILTLLSVRPSTGGQPWVLSSPLHGALALDDTLADRSVMDGSTLHLTTLDDAAQGAFVDDVISEMNRQVDAGFTPWSVAARSRWAVGTASILGLLACVLASVASPDPWVAASAAVLVIVALGSALVL
ncbi:MAG: EsaB/YukD family protein, partial [Rhodococcus sp. (in: high G+C Gram-positive bacteria)]